MKIKMLPVGNSPDYYKIVGEIITAHKGSQSESFDLSSVQEGDQFLGVECDTLELNGLHVIRNAYRDTQGILHVDLCQQVGPGHWETGVEFDSADYNPADINVVYREDKPHAGIPWALTIAGRIEV